MRPESIENRWDILYREYPEVYDEFASVPYEPDWVVSLSRMLKIDWSGKLLLMLVLARVYRSIDLAAHQLWHFLSVRLRLLL